MKLTSEFSTIEFDDEKIKTQNRKNIFNEKSETKYNEIYYTSIKEIKTRNFNKLSKITFYFTLVIGVFTFLGNLRKKEYTNPFVPEWDSTYYFVETTTEERITYFVLGLIIIIIGFYLKNIIKKKYDEINVLTILYLDGKQKNLNIFSSKNKEEIEQVKNKLQSKVK